MATLNCMICGKEFEGDEPKYCCQGTIRDACGCMGLPIDPIICSITCGIILYNKNKVFYDTAIIEDNIFDDFGIHPKSAVMYGRKPEDIVDVEMRISDDQSIPKTPTKSADYWGWFDFEETALTLVWKQRILLEMCFPYGTKILEEKEMGKMFRLNVSLKKK